MTAEYVVKDDAVLSLSGEGLRELLAAVLERGAPFRFRADGFSMSPFIRAGDVITLVPIPAGRRISLGDVVAFINPCNVKLTVHRVVCAEDAGYWMRGDNLPDPDGQISRSDILGRVTQIERRGRRVRIGLGPERGVIAFLSRHGWLIPLLVPARFTFHLFRGRHD